MIISLLLLAGIFSMFAAFVLLIILAIFLLKSKKTNKKLCKVLAVVTGCYILAVPALMALQPQMVIYKDYPFPSAAFQGGKYTYVNSIAPIIKDLTKLDYVGMVEDENVPWMTRKINKFIFPRLVYAKPGDTKKKVIWVFRSPIKYPGGPVDPYKSMMRYSDREARVEQFERVD